MTKKTSIDDYLAEVPEDAGAVLRTYDTSKGTIRFPVDKPLPVALVKKLVKAHMKENEARSSR